MSSIQQIAACLCTLAAVVQPSETFKAEQAELSAKAGLSVRSTQRALDDLKARGVIAGARGSYRILDPAELANLANGAAEVTHDTTKEDTTRHDRATRQVQRRHATRHDTPEAEVSEVASLRAEVASLRAEVASLRLVVSNNTPAPTLPSTLDAEALVGRIMGALDALRAEVKATRQSDTPTPDASDAHPTRQSDTPTTAGTERGSADAHTSGAAVEGEGAADDLEALQQLVSLAKDKRGKGGSMSGAARLLGVTEGGVRHALRVRRVTPELAEKVWAALASLDAAGG